MPGDWQAGVDIGGTFTDLLLVNRRTGAFVIDKVLTDHANPAVAVRDGLSGLLHGSAADAGDLGTMVHATTLATNAIIERKGARTALLITEGFRDTLLIGREHRYDMYDLLLQKPDALVPRRDTIAVPERILADGTVLRPLDEEAVAAIGDLLAASGIRAVAVCLLHSYRYPQHERRVREILLGRAPQLHVTLSHEVIGEQREYERASTAVANAYVLELVDRYLNELQRDLARIGHRGQFLIMLSNSATATPETARAFPVRLIESGPAAGALAAAEAGRLMGRPQLLSFDMGGTTAKACIIDGGQPSIAAEWEVARLQRFKKGSGLPLEISSVDLIEIGAGGGSIARIDQFGLVQVGPESVGSDPGPACYGLGGTRPTVTDADLLLGYLDPGFFLGGRIRLDPDAARRALEERLARPLGIDVVEAAQTVHEVVNENMANATRIHAVERGANLQEFPLFAFGGAGPVHAYRVARNLGIAVVIAPLGAGIGSTIGLLAAPLAFDFVRTTVAPLDGLDWSLVGDVLESMEKEGVALLTRAGLPRDQIRIERAADMRLIGQAHEITVELPGPRPKAGDEARLEGAFGQRYIGLFKRRPPDISIEVVSWRVRVAGPRGEFRLALDPRTNDPAEDRRVALKGTRPAYWPELRGFHSTPVYDRYALAPGTTVEGPAIVEERESTFVFGPGSHGRVDEHLNLVVELLA